MLRSVSKPCRVSIEEPLFPIHSIQGSSTVRFASHFNSKRCAYASESIAIVWNWTLNIYQYLIGGHRNEDIHSLCFHPNGQYLITSSLHSVCLWDLSTSTVLYCCRFSESTICSTRRTLCHVTMSQNGQNVVLTTNTFMIVYNLYIPNNSNPELITMAYYEFMEPKELMLSLKAMNNFHHQFVTLSFDQIQFWNFTPNSNSNPLNALSSSTNQIQNICTKSMDSMEHRQHTAIGRFEAMALDDSDHIYVLGQLGSVMLLDHEGNLLSHFNAQHPNCTFCGLDIGTRYLVLSTSNGAIEVWRKDTLSYLRSVSYPAALRQKLEYKISRKRKGTKFNQYNQCNKYHINTINHQYDKSKPNRKCIAGFECQWIALDEDDNSMIVRYADHSLCVLQLNSSRLIRYNLGHFRDIITLCVSCNDTMKPAICHQDDSWIISSSKDQTLHIWKRGNAKSANSGCGQSLRLKHIIDMRRVINPEFTYFDHHRGRDHSDLVYASSIAYGKGTGLIAVGDNFGYIRILNVQHSDNVTIHSISNVSTSKIKSLCFDLSQNLLLVHRSNHEVTIFNTTKRTNALIPLLCIQKAVDLETSRSTKCLVQKSYLLQHKSTWQNERDSQCWIGTTHHRRQIVLRVFHLDPDTNATTFHSRNHPLRFENKVIFEIPEGVISDFVVHPSEEYVAIASSIGTIYIYHLLTAKCCSAIQCDQRCVSITFDPSGLYLCCVLLTDHGMKGDLKGGDQINLYQIGTQEFIGEIGSIGSIRHCQFAEDGSLLLVSGGDGVIKSLTVPKGMVSNIKQTMNGMHRNPHFWSRFPFPSNFNLSDHRSESIEHSKDQRGSLSNIPMDSYKDTDRYLYDEQYHRHGVNGRHRVHRRHDVKEQSMAELQEMFQQQYSVLSTPRCHKLNDHQMHEMKEMKQINEMKERNETSISPQSRYRMHHEAPWMRESAHSSLGNDGNSQYLNHEHIIADDHHHDDHEQEQEHGLRSSSFQNNEKRKSIGVQKTEKSKLSDQSMRFSPPQRRLKNSKMQIRYEPERDELDENIVPIHTYSKLEGINTMQENTGREVEDDIMETQFVESIHSENGNEEEIPCSLQPVEDMESVGNRDGDKLQRKGFQERNTFHELLSINAMIEDSQDTDLAMLDDQLTESRTKTMLSEFNSTLKKFDDFDWSDTEEHDDDKYAPLNVVFTKKEKEKEEEEEKEQNEEAVDAEQEVNVEEMCRNILGDIVDQIETPPINEEIVEKEEEEDAKENESNANGDEVQQEKEEDADKKENEAPEEPSPENKDDADWEKVENKEDAVTEESQ